MRIAFLHYMQKKNEEGFYYYGWKDALKDHEVVEKDCVYNSLVESDGDFDLCFVSPGFIKYKEHLYKKKSKTKFVLLADEDMHQPVEGLRCMADYYDFIFVHTDINYIGLQILGARNVRQILPCYNPGIFFPIEKKKKYDATFLGQFDKKFNIGGSTRFEICTDLENDEGIKQFVGKGFYASSANEIYNESHIALDLPIMTIVGGRSFGIGATTATLMLPAKKKNSLFENTFIPGEDYIEFNKAKDLNWNIRGWLHRPDERQKIRKNMNKKMLKHTYAERFKEILNITFDGDI